MRLEVKMLVLLAMISPLYIQAAVMKQTMADVQGPLFGEPPNKLYYSLYVRPPVQKRQVNPNELKSLGHPHAEHFEEGFKIVAKGQRLRGGSVDVSQGKLVYEGTIPPKASPVYRQILIAPKSSPLHKTTMSQSHIIKEVVISDNKNPIGHDGFPSTVINQAPISQKVMQVTWSDILDQAKVPQGSFSTNHKMIEDAPTPAEKELNKSQNQNINILPSHPNLKLFTEKGTEQKDAISSNLPVFQQNQQKSVTDKESNPDDLLIFIDEPLPVEEPESLYDPYGYDGDDYVSIEEHFGDEGNLKFSTDKISEKYPITTYRPENQKYFQSSGNIRNSNTISTHKNKLMKLMEKPKKFMKVIKTLGAGHYVPSAVPGIMVQVEGGSEEAFVPEDIIRSSDYILETAASENLLSFAVPEDQLAVESGLEKQFSVAARAPVPMKGMPYNFGWIVDDEATANYQTRQETANNEGVVMGCYQVLEPTGLVRTVTYIADDGGFRILNLTKGPDKTPCPGIEEAGRLAANSAKSLNQPQPIPPRTPPTLGTNFQSSFNQASSKSSSSNFTSESYNSVNNAIVFERPTTTYSPPPPPTTTTPRPTPPTRVPITTAPPTEASAAYSLAGLAQQAWMAEYLQNITQHLYSSFSNSSTQTNIFGSGRQGLINFPFVMIPITTFLDLQRRGAIDSNTQTYGAFIQPQLTAGFAKSLSSQIAQPQHQQAQKVVQKTTTNVYNTTQSKVKQVKHRQEGVNTINYQINGVEGQTPKVTQQVSNQFKSSQSSHEAKQSSSNSASSTSTNVNYNAGGGRQLVQQNYQGNQAPQAATSSSNNNKQYNNVGRGHASQQVSNQFKSSQSSHEAKQSSSNSASSTSTNVNYNAGGGRQLVQQNYQGNQAPQAATSSSNNNKQYNNVGRGHASQQYSQQQSSEKSQSSKSSSSNNIQTNYVGSNANSAFRQPSYVTPFTVRPSKRPTPLPSTIRQPVVLTSRPKYNVRPKQLTQQNNQQRHQNIQQSVQKHMSSQSSQAQNSKSSSSNNRIVNNNGHQQVSQAYQSQQASKDSKSDSSSSSSSSIGNINNGRQQIAQQTSQQKSSQSSSSSSSSSNTFQSNQARAQAGKFPKQLSSSINSIPRAVQPSPVFGTRIPIRKPTTTKRPFISPRPAQRPFVVSRPVSTTRRPFITPKPTTTTLRAPKSKPHTFSSISFNVPTPIKTSPVSRANSGSFSSQSSKSSQNEKSSKSNSLVQSNLSSAGKSYASQNASASSSKSSDSNSMSSQYTLNGGNSKSQQASSSSSKSSSSSSSSSQSAFQSFNGENSQSFPSNLQPTISIPTPSFSSPAIRSQPVTYNQPIPRKAPETPLPLKVEELIIPRAEPIVKSKNMEGWIPMTSKLYHKQPTLLQATPSTRNIGNQFQFSSSSSKNAKESSSSNQSKQFSGTWAGPGTSVAKSNSVPATQNLGAASGVSSSSSNSHSSQSSNSQSSQQYSGSWNGGGNLPQESFAPPPPPQISQFQAPDFPQFQVPEIPQFQNPAIPQFQAPNIPQFKSFGVPNSFQTYDDPQTQVRTWNSQNYGR